jgi:hypothetical protein
MVEIFNQKKQKGFVLIIAFLAMIVLFALGSYFLTFTLTDFKISESQSFGEKAYYLAEAGVNEAIWKLQNDHSTSDGDPAWADDFIDSAKNPVGGPYWSDEFVQPFAGGTYTISIQNSRAGTGDIISTSQIPLGNGNYSQRVVKVSVSRALASPVKDSAMYTGGASGNFSISSSNITITKGNLFCGNIFNISSSNITVTDNPDTDGLEGQILVTNNNLISSSNINSESICAKNYCTPECQEYAPGSSSCPPDSIDVPLVDFNSAASNSFKSRAQAAQNAGQCQILCNGTPCSTNCILASNQFNNLSGSLTINSPITYVTGSINISIRNVVLKGALVSENDINISASHITMSSQNPDSPLGFLSKRKMNISSSAINGPGVIYCLDELNMSSSSGSITGGIMSRKSNFSSVSPFNITLDNGIILNGLGYIINGESIVPIFSPTILTNHWEESY